MAEGYGKTAALEEGDRGRLGFLSFCLSADTHPKEQFGVNTLGYHVTGIQSPPNVLFTIFGAGLMSKFLQALVFRKIMVWTINADLTEYQR